ncbi:MAG: PilZ domain-containing protein [Pseudomonadota bacterium]
MGKRDQRRYQRIALNMPAEVVINSIDIVPATLVNVSPGGLAVICETPVQTGDTVIVYARGLDILPGRVVRHLPDGFAASLILSRSHRKKLIEQLFLQTNTDYREKVSERRATPRHGQGDQRNVCRLTDGTGLYVKIIDMSVNGAAVDCLRKPAIGSAIRLAQRQGIVVRHTPRGFAIVFDDIPQRQDKTAGENPAGQSASGTKARRA